MTTLYTIGCSGTSAESFFTRLKDAGITTLYDIRRYRNYHGAGWARERDLAYLVHSLTGGRYGLLKSFAPSRKLLLKYKSCQMEWVDYAAEYRKEIADKGPAIFFHPLGEDPCLLCACAKPEFCHRTLAAEMFAERVTEINSIVHL